MSEDITQDPEYIRGYEKAKELIEDEKSAYSQGWYAARKEQREKEQKEDGEAKSTAAVTISVNYPQMEKILSFMERLLEHNKQLIEHNERLIGEMKTYHERLKNLERYTQE
jgi:chemotaxis protein histidine kinase CheA